MNTPLWIVVEYQEWDLNAPSSSIPNDAYFDKEDDAVGECDRLEAGKWETTNCVHWFEVVKIVPVSGPLTGTPRPYR